MTYGWSARGYRRAAVDPRRDVWSIARMTPRLACCLSLGLVACVLLAAPAAAGKETSEQRRERLEIQKLEAETGTVADLRGWATIAVVMFTGGAFAVSVLRFGHEVRDARTLRREERFEANLERLTDFAGSESGMLTRALVALHNLRSLSTGDAELRERVTAAITTVVREELDLSNSRHAQFELLCVQEWPDSRERIRNHTEANVQVLYRLRNALAVLHAEEPTFYGRLQLRAGEFVGQGQGREAKLERLRPFAVSYRDHVDLLVSGPARDRAITWFSDALDNNTLARHFLGGGAE